MLEENMAVSFEPAAYICHDVMSTLLLVPCGGVIRSPLGYAAPVPLPDVLVSVRARPKYFYIWS